MKTLLRVLTTLLGPLVVLTLVATPTGPAGAHGGEGEAEITSITRDGDDVTVTVHLAYEEDGHGVPDATVTVVADDGTPVPMEAGAEEGDYTATLAAPEGATIRVTSVEPETTAEGTAPAAAETPTTADPTTSDDATSSTEAPTTQAPADTAPEPNGLDEAPDEDDGGGNVIVLVVLVVVVVAAIGAAYLLRRKKPGEV